MWVRPSVAGVAESLGNLQVKRCNLPLVCIGFDEFFETEHAGLFRLVSGKPGPLRSRHQSQRDCRPAALSVAEAILENLMQARTSTDALIDEPVVPDRRLVPGSTPRESDGIKGPHIRCPICGWTPYRIRPAGCAHTATCGTPSIQVAFVKNACSSGSTQCVRRAKSGRHIQTGIKRTNEYLRAVLS